METETGDWPLYDNQSKKVMQLKRDNITVIPDGKDTLYLNMGYKGRLTELTRLGYRED